MAALSSPCLTCCQRFVYEFSFPKQHEQLLDPRDWAGDSLEPCRCSGPSNLKKIPHDGRAAHGPGHPATNIPLRLCRDYISFAGWFFGMGFCFVVKVFFVSGVGMVSGALKDLTLLCFVFASLFLCVIVWFVGDVCSLSLSLFFFFSGAGETEARRGWVF